MTPSRRSNPVKARLQSLDQFSERCAAALSRVCASAADGGSEASEAHGIALRCLVALLAVLSASEQIGMERSAAKALRSAAALLADAAKGAAGCLEDCKSAFCKVRQSTGLGIFSIIDQGEISEGAFAAAVSALISPRPDAPIEPLFFQTMPPAWLGQIYERMLALKPNSEGGLERDCTRRKLSGVYFTPPPLVEYVVRSALEPLVDRIPGALGDDSVDDNVCRTRVLDPASGGGDFLAEAVQFLSAAAAQGAQARDAVRARVAANCVFGLDIDPIAVEIARFRVWVSGGFADGLGEAINSHIVCADAIGSSKEEAFDWRATFADALSMRRPSGFDAVVGNPPYVASKNGLRAGSGRGQADCYLLFLSEIINRRLVRRGGTLAMVLPDPFLERANAAEIRRTLVSDWNLTSLLHILGSFTDASVANVVPVISNCKSDSPEFHAVRIERAADQRAFSARPVRTAQELSEPVTRSVVLAQGRCELLYLLEGGTFGDTIRRIHGPEMCLSHYEPPFAPLESLNVRAIYRGEEVGKSAIPDSETGLPMLMGGQSVHPFEIAWEGKRIPESRVVKPVERYTRRKVLIQKSSAKVVAAVDTVSARHPGYVFPQSVYAVELGGTGMDEFYLLCILNSELMNEYVRRTVTGYKMVQPQLEIENIRGFPIRRVSFTTQPAQRRSLVKRGMAIFERESSEYVQAARFPRLGNFAAECLVGGLEMSDVVHDLLAFLGRRITRLTAKERRSSDSAMRVSLHAARSAADTVVWQLYSHEPLQLALAF